MSDTAHSVLFVFFYAIAIGIGLACWKGSQIIKRARIVKGRLKHDK